MSNKSNNPLDWMMWQIDSKQKEDPPLQNLVRAIQYYTEKYGHVPNCCEISPDWGPDLVVPEGMRLTRSNSVQPGNILLAQNSAIKTTLPGKNSKK